MTAKTSATRTNAFFKALSETGNQTISAERACVSRSWVSQHRQRDPAFRARMEDCIAAARARLSGAGGVACAPVVGAKWGVIHGEELVLHGTGGAGSGRWGQVARAGVCFVPGFIVDTACPHERSKSLGGAAKGD